MDASDASEKKVAKFKSPFKIYENFRNVYKKGKKQVIFVPEEESSDESSSSPESSLTSNLTSRIDGNSTDDSGIDSIGDARSRLTGRPRRNVWKREFVLNGGGASASSSSAASSDALGEDCVLSGEVELKSVRRGQSFLSSQDAKTLEDQKIEELSQLINETGALLCRNSNLRASLTIAVRDGKDRRSTTFAIPTPKKQTRKKIIVPVNIDSEEEDGPSDKHDGDDLPVSAFVRHNPARKPVTTTGAIVTRKSIKLAPCTVAKLASQFDNSRSTMAPASSQNVGLASGCSYPKTKPMAGRLSTNEAIKPSQRPMSTKPEAIKPSSEVGITKPKPVATKLPEKELKLCNKRDISKIISALNRLDEEARKDTAVLRRSLRRAAIAAARKGGNETSDGGGFCEANISKEARVAGTAGSACSSDGGGGNNNNSAAKRHEVREDSCNGSSKNSSVTSAEGTHAEQVTTIDAQPLTDNWEIDHTTPIKEQQDDNDKSNDFADKNQTCNPTSPSTSLTSRYLQTLAVLAQENDQNFSTKAATQNTHKSNPPNSPYSKVIKKESFVKKGLFDAVKVQKNDSIRSVLSNRPPAVRRNESLLRKALESNQYEKCGSISTYGGYDDIMAPSHKYIDLVNQSNSYMDLASAVYSEIGSRRSFAYDEVGQSQHEDSYLSLLDETEEIGLRRSISEDNISVMTRYEPIDEDNLPDPQPPSPPSLVKAMPAIILEDGTESCLYHEIAQSRSSTLNSRFFYDGTLGADLYESIAGSILNLACGKAGTDQRMQDIYSICDKTKKAARSPNNPDEMLSYTLAKLSEVSNPGFKRSNSKRGSVMSSSTDKSTSDEWVDIDTDTDYEESQFTCIERNQSFIRTSGRMSHRTRGKWQNRSIRKPWNLAVKEVQRKEQSKGAQSDDDLYESIYEVVNPPHGNHVRHPRRSYDDFDSESEFDEIIEEDEYQVNNNQVGPQSQYGALNNSKPLSKFAEAAGKKMKKLRRNWSLKKNDITRSLSRIRKNSRPMFPTTTGDTIFREALRRRPSRQPSFSAAKNVVKCNGQTLSNKMGDTAMFYITLNIEDINNKDQEPMAEEGGETKNASPQQPAMVVPPRTRKGSAKNNYSVVRPTEAPPLPPPKKMTSSQDQLSPGSTTSSSSDSQLPANDSLREFYVGYSEDGSSNASSSELGITDIEETYTSSLFQTEPLYQFYDRDLCSQTSTDTDTETIINEDGGLANIYQADCAQENMYESVGSRSATLDNRRSQSLSHPSSSVDVPELPARRKLKNRSSAMDLLHRSANGRRSMWGELPEVIDSGILDAISKDEKRLQEALFEVISSEASYLKSLNVLISHFMQSSKFMDVSVISKRDYRILFSDVIAVRQCSEKFLEDLENRWQASVILTGIPEIVQKHAQHHFQVYVKYCSNQVYQDRILKKLKTENPKFGETLRELESNPICQSLDMHSFLMLPMQRITRLPLLIDAIYHRLNTHSQEYNSCKEALQILNKIVKECNESARNMERMEELLLLSHQLDFKDVRAVPLISASRWLVKRGEVTRIWWRDNAEARLTFGRKVNRQTLTLFLFTDLLVIAKKKGDEQFTVVDHCPRNLVTLAEVDSLDGIPGGGKYLSENNMCWLTLLQNHDSKTVEWLISFNFESDRLRWIEQVTPQQSHNPEEKIYEEWDCPQVEGVANYATQDSDELALQIGETANVLRKLSDSGWYYVERRRDGCRGWIPMAVTKEIESNHVRARNFKQRHAFLKLISTESVDSIAPESLLGAAASNSSSTTAFHRLASS